MQNKKNNGKSVKNKVSKKVLMTRILALILCLLMVGGAFTIILQFFYLNTYAADTDNGDFNAESKTDALDFNISADEKIRVGLMYGNGVTVGFETRAVNGFEINIIDDHNIVKLWQVTDNCVSVTCDSNLSKQGMTYLKSGTENCVIGGWHIEITPAVNVNTENIDGLYAYYKNLIEPLGYNIFPVYDDNTVKFRAGQFSTEKGAREALTIIPNIIADPLAVAGPSASAVSVLDPYTDMILFEFNSNGSQTLGLTAIQTDENPAYLITPANNYYTGVFEYKRYINGATDGVALTNILPLESYITGVLPYEIGTSWPLEVQKAFSVTVRSFTVSMLGRHKSSYGFDLCNSTHCQVYMGIKRASDMTRQAVSETTGVVLVYNGKFAKTFYSAVSGGITVSADEAWGGVGYPYLKAVATPWENYSQHSNGTWTVEVSPLQLFEYLKKKGYNNLQGSIADIKINKFAENSSYVYSITFTDIYGNKVTVEHCDNIRSTLGAYLKSANFVVARAGESVAVTNYALATDVPFPSSNDPQILNNEDVSTKSPVCVMTADGIVEFVLQETLSIVKSTGMAPIKDFNTLFVLTGSGATVFDTAAEAETANNGDGDLNSDLGPAAEKQRLPDLSDILSLRVIKTEHLIRAEGKAGNFVFIGRGWGHGVGMSQHGALNLAELGYDYTTILTSYFPGTKLQNLNSYRQ